jgi:hypothetical protein
MSLLTVDLGGPNETVLPFARAGHAEPRTVGTRRFAFAGNERSMIRAEPHVIPLVGANLPAATVATLRSIFALGTQVRCSGDLFNNGGASVLCSGEIADEMEVGGTYWIPTLTLYEVGSPTAGQYQGSVDVAGAGTATVTLLGPRRGTVAPAGVATVTLTMDVRRRATVSAAGIASVAVVLRKKASASAAGTASVTATGSVI